MMDGGSYAKIPNEEHEPGAPIATIEDVAAAAPRRADNDGVSRKDLQPMQLEESQTGWKRFSDVVHGHWDSFIRRPVLPFVSMFILMFIMMVGIVVGVVLQKSHSDGHTCKPTSDWKGWGGIKHSFVFGDSYSSTSFDYQKEQPSQENPLGNPAFPGATSCNATNWIGFLATKYNDSAFQTYNLAVGGAALDNNVVAGFPISVTDQVYTRFMPRYARYLYDPLWKPNDTLFTLFSGINDLVMMNGITSPDKLETIFTSLELVYAKLFSALYGIGARNFLILNIPPLERVWQPPFLPHGGADMKAKFTIDVVRYNTMLKRISTTLKAQFPDVNIFTYDVHTLFNRALDNPKTFPQTSGILNTTNSCNDYAGGTPTPDYLLPICNIPVNQYFWFATMHPTYPIHDVLAEKVAETLRGNEVSC